MKVWTVRFWELITTEVWLKHSTILMNVYSLMMLNDYI